MKLINVKSFIVLVCSMLVVLNAPAAFASDKKPKKEKPLVIPSDKSLGFITGTRNEVLGNNKRIGLLPIYLPESFAKREDVKQKIMEQLVSKLTAAGFEVVTPESYQQSYDNLNKKLGGIYNADSGAKNIAQDNAIRVAARRDFIEKNHLTSFILPSVDIEQAEIIGKVSMFCGAVMESTYGKMPSFWSGDVYARGSLPALCVEIHMFNTQDKLMFSAWGGIQLTSYFDQNYKAERTSFLDVRVEDLLRDDKRIERGLDLALRGLVHTPEEIAKNDGDPKLDPLSIKMEQLPEPPNGIPPREPSPFKVDREKLIASIKKIIILPMSTSKIEVSKEVKDRIMNQLELELNSQHFKEEKIEVVRGPDVFENVFKDIQNMKGLFNVYTGEYDEAKVSALRKKALESLNLSPDTLVLYPTITRIRANHKSGVAYWYGTRQDIFTFGEPEKGSFWNPAPVHNGEGMLGASVLSVAIRDSNDALVYNYAGGIELLEVPPKDHSEKPTPRAPNELFVDTNRQIRSAYLAIRPLLKTETEIELEVHPEKEKQIKEKAKEKERKNKKSKSSEASETTSDAK